MWDTRIIEDNPQQLLTSLQQRGISVADLTSLNERIAERRTTISKIERLNAERNRVAAGAGNTPTDRQMNARGVREQARHLKAQLAELDAIIDTTVLGLPNRPHESVPAGDSAKDNLVVRTWSTPTAFTFEPKDHIDIGRDLGIIDIPAGVRLAGTGFPCLTGLGARLNRAVINFMLDLHCRNGFLEVAPPFVANRDCFFGTGQMPKFENELYWTEQGQFGLVPTAEVPLTNLHRGEILSESDLPRKFTAYTPCWRREAGSYGKDTKGLIRVHQFDKVELVKYTTREASYSELESLADEAEEVLRQLGIPHRRVLLCAGDLGFSAAKTYDVEAWIPSQSCFREISSCSNCEDFQSRRMKLRCRRSNGKVEYVHTLNGSGLAAGRTVVAILENYQNADGSVRVPEVLLPYMDGVTEVRPR